MNRLLKIKTFCDKIGIFTDNQNGFKLGPYGHLILNHLKSEFVKSNLKKFPNTYIIENQDILKNSFDLNPFADKLTELFCQQSEPVSFMNVFESENTSTDQNSLFKNKKTVTNLNYIKLNSQDIDEQIDLYSFWQRERYNWWVKVAYYPENLIQEKHELFYQFDENEPKNKIETILSLDDSTDLKNLNLSEKIKGLITSNTTCETILENLLIDSIEFPEDLNLNEKLKKYGVSKREKIYFNLDFRLAPFKACILYKKDDQNNLKHVADDFRKLFYLKNRQNVFVNEINDDNDLEAKYDHLDILGIPYTIYLPSTITKDGLCFVRNRDTSLSEHTHLKLAVDQLNAISNALVF